MDLFHKCLAAAAILCCLCTLPASAQSSPMINFDPSTAASELHLNAMIGWTFHVKSTIRISQVGWYDEGLDGLSRPFQVGLWQDLSGGYFAPGSNPTPLLGTFGTVVPGGTTAPLNGIYRVVDLPAPIDLVPGDYELAGLDSSGTTDVIKYKMLLTPDAYRPDVDVRQFIWGGADGNSSFHPVNHNYFYLLYGVEIGPMLFEVPEPASSALLPIAAVMLGAGRRRA